MAQSRGPAENQLRDYRRDSTVNGSAYMRTATGCPIGVADAILTASKNGPALLQDFIFLDHMAHFNRERIPERGVHVSFNQ